MTKFTVEKMQVSTISKELRNLFIAIDNNALSAISTDFQKSFAVKTSQKHYYD